MRSGRLERELGSPAEGSQDACGVGRASRFGDSREELGLWVHLLFHKHS